MSADLFGVISLQGLDSQFTTQYINEIKVFSPSNKSIAFHSDCVVSLLVSTKHIVYVYIKKNIINMAAAQNVRSRSIPPIIPDPYPFFEP
jgi:hypothetical protein